MKNLDWGNLSVGQMTSLFAALRETQARGRQTLGHLGRELSAAAPVSRGESRREATPAADPEIVEDEPEEGAAPAEEPYQAPVRLPAGMYVADRPDGRQPASLPSYHPAVTGNMANAVGGDADERAVAAAARTGRSLFN